MKFQVLGFNRVHLPKHFGVLYYGAPIFLSLPKDEDNTMPLGRVMLTKVGQELAPICGSKPVDGFLDYIRDKWRSEGYVIGDKPNQPDLPNVDSIEQ